jgi:hypothetical protein
MERADGSPHAGEGRAHGMMLYCAFCLKLVPIDALGAAKNQANFL